MNLQPVLHAFISSSHCWLFCFDVQTGISIWLSMKSSWMSSPGAPVWPGSTSSVLSHQAPVTGFHFLSSKLIASSTDFHSLKSFQWGRICLSFLEAPLWRFHLLPAEFCQSMLFVYLEISSFLGEGDVIILPCWVHLPSD